MDSEAKWNASMKLLSEKLWKIAVETNMSYGDVSYETYPIKDDTKYKLVASVVYSRYADNISSLVDMYLSELHKAVIECGIQDVVKIQAVAADDTNEIVTMQEALDKLNSKAT